MTDSFAAVCSIAPTQRRRLLWAAWWSGPPTRVPFRPPDAWSGGAKTAEEARRDATRAAGRELVDIEPRWARAWARVLRGQPPWIGKEEGGARVGRARAVSASSWCAVLELPPTATIADIKRAFRRRALETHPDRGGEPEAFRTVQHAYEQALARKKPHGRKPRRAR